MPDASIRVICRFRPVNAREKAEGEAKKDAPQLEFPDDYTVVVKVPKAKPAIYQFDRVFWSPATTQREVYENAAKDTIEDVLSGYNGTIFAYGQTGAGKSFSMSGADVTNPETKGIIPRACDHIFQHIAADAAGTEYTLKCSFLEIYKENIHDLLDPTAEANLKVRETPSRGVWVQGLSEHFVTSVEDIIDLLQTGEKYRAVSATRMNAVSSRSHSLFILTLIQRNPDGSTKEGKLNLADLAGSEKVGKTGASGETLEEAKKINQSLSALGNCINALTKAKRGHVPYRDSKLTHILRESLGGNSKTTLLIACSPHVFNVEETISTLKFGQRAKTIKNNVHVNQQRSVKELEAIIDNLTKELAYLKLYSEHLERDLLKLDATYDLAALRKRLATQQAEKAKAEQAAQEVPYDDENPETATTTSTEGDIDDDNNSNEEDFTSNPSTPAKGPSTPRRGNDSPVVPGTPQVHFDASYDPMALAEAQLQISQMRERYELRVLDLKDEVNRLTSENRESEESLEQAQQYVQTAQKEVETLKAELAREREEAQLRQSSAEYEVKKKQLEIESQLTSLTESKGALESEVGKLKEAAIKANSEAEIARDERDALDKKLKAAQADAQRWKLRVDSGAADAAKKEAALQKRKADEADARAKALDKELHALRIEVEASKRKTAEGQVELDKVAKERAILERSLSQMNVGDAGNSAISAPNATTEALQALDLSSAVQKKDIEIKELKANLESQTKLAEDSQVAIRQLQDIIASNEADMNERAKQREHLLRESEEALTQEKDAREKAETESRALKRQLAAQETRLVSTTDLLERTQRETQQAALNMTKQMDQAGSRVKELEATIESMHERYNTLQQQLDDTVEKFAKMSAEFSDQLKAEQQENMQLRNSMQRTHRAANTQPGMRRSPSNIPRQIKGGQGVSGGGSATPSTPEPQRGFVDWLFGRDPMPSQDQLQGSQKKGMLFKQSGLFKTWKQQWFVLKGHKLYYFDSKDAKTPDGVYQIDGCSPNTKRDVEPDSAYRFQFTISHPSRKTVYLCAQSGSEMTSWIEVIDELATCTRGEAEGRAFVSNRDSIDTSQEPEPAPAAAASSTPGTPSGTAASSSTTTPSGTPSKPPQSVKLSTRINVSAPKTPAPQPGASNTPTKTGTPK